MTPASKLACKIAITSEKNHSSVPLYEADTLTATVGDDCGVSEIVWSVDPGKDETHAFSFSDHRSPVVNGTATTKITGFGDNSDVTVTVYARPAETDSQVKEPGKLSLTFKAQDNVPAGTKLSLVSLDNDPLKTGEYHLFRASFLDLDGTKASVQGWNGTVKWGALSDDSATWLNKVTATDAEGFTTNAIMSKSPGDVTLSATVASPSHVYTRAVKVTFADDATIPGQGKMTIAPVHTPVIGRAQSLTVEYLDGNGNPMPEGTLVTWYATPSDHLTFSGGSGPGSTGNISKVTGSQGIATINVTGSEGTAIEKAVIATRGLLNAQSGAYDHSNPDLVLSFRQAPSDAGVIKIETTEWMPLTPYAPHELTATYTHAENGPPFKQTDIIWSAFPSGKFEFEQNPTRTDDSGKATNRITALSTDFEVPAVVFARAYNPASDIRHMEIGSLSLSFQDDTPPAKQGHIDLMPLEGDLLEQGEYAIQATYRRLDGGFIANQDIQWTVDQPDIVSVQTSQPTDNQGVTVATITCTPASEFAIVKVTASATNPYTGDTESSSLLVCLGTSYLSPPKSAGSLVLNPTDHPPYMEGTSYGLRLTYRNPHGTVASDRAIYWAAYPGENVSERLTFSGKSPINTDSSGKETNQITCSIGNEDVHNALIAAGSPNYANGSYDAGQARMSFEAASTLSGIMIDKPFCHCSLTQQFVDATDLTQVIVGQVKLTGQGSGNQSVKLMPTPSNAGISVFKEDDLSTGLQQQDDGSYIVETDASGVATFRVGSVSHQLVTLTASAAGFENTAPNGATKLAITNVNRNYATPALPQLIINGSFFPVPSDQRAFTVNIPANSGVRGTDTVAVILNDRVVFYGTGAQLIAGVPIAYAVLNVSDRGSVNTIAYLQMPAGSATTFLSAPRRFSASGTPQTGPNPPITPTLDAPKIVAKSPIGPDAIVGGLKIEFPSGLQVNPGDTVTVYFYLTGADPLTEIPVNNIATATVTPDGKAPQELWLDQVYAAGYGAPGTLQADFGITSQSSQTPLSWSRPSDDEDINTTFTVKS